ncbi:hypothetical protein ACIBI3_00805 [Actinomadura luteofluorescens]|uniref:hypothetical protein n=1 Tax=Actinomadura luteofluorescens TaxID=46163 RepID=UPI003471269E
MAPDDEAIDYADLARELASMIHGYPYGDPFALLGWIAAEVRSDPGTRHGRAMTAALWGSRWYVKWQVTDPALVDDLIEAAGRARTVLEAADCALAGEHEHPLIVDDPEEVGDLVARIGDPEGWLARRADDEKIEAYACPGYLAELAAEAEEALKDARAERFEAPDTSHLDERFLTADGRADIDAVMTDIERQKYSSIDPTAESAALWAARRLLGDARPEEWASLALAVSHVAQHCVWGSAAPGVVALYRDGLRTFDLSALDRPCPHPEEHPKIRLRQVSALARAMAPDAAPVDEQDGCPWRIAAHVREVIDYTGGYLGVEEAPAEPATERAGGGRD